MKKKSNEDITYNLLPDVPLKPDKKQEVQFGHDQIAEVISDLVRNINPPFTIGLFGRWGTGKSTILNFVKESLISSNIPTVTFDVWKYDDDSLRRQFLIVLDEQLELKRDYKRVLNQSLSKPYELNFWDDLKLNTSKLLTRTSVLALLAFIIFTGIGYLNFIPLSWLFSTLRDSAFIVFILSYLIGSINIAQGMIQESKTDSAEGFEDKFYNEVLKDLENKGNKKILIIIDNLDRTTHDKAVSLLSDIKTFLGKDNDENKAIFLIACDEEAIKKHLEKSNFDNPSEFLRKFFNTSVRIPKFLGEELEEYTRDLLKQSKVKAFERNSELEWLLTYTFRDNPREIKQIINTLISHYLLAKKAEDKGQITQKGLITEKPEVLAKVIILQQKFPTVYKHIEYLVIDKGFDWQEISSNYEVMEISSESEDKQKLLKKEEQEFRTFILATRQIEIENLLIYIKLRQSRQEQRLPSLPSFILAAESRKIEEAKEIYEKSLKKETSYFDDVLKRYIMRARQGNKIPKLMILSFTTIQVATENLENLPKFIHELILSFPTKGDLLNYLADFTPFNTYTLLKSLVEEKNFLKKDLETLTEAYISLLNLPGATSSTIPNEHVMGLVEMFTVYKVDFLKYKKSISNIIKEFYSEYLILNIFVKNDAQEYISKEIILKYLDSIDQTNISDHQYINDRLELLLKFNLNEVLHAVIQRFSNWIIFEGQQGFRPENRIIILEHLYELLNNEDRLQKIFNIKESSQPSTLEKLTETLISWYQQDTSHQYRIKCIKVIDKLIQLPDNPYTSSGKDKVEDFIRGWSSPDTIKELPSERLNIYSVPLNEAIQRTPDIFDAIYKDVSSELNDGFLINLFNKNPELALSKLQLAKNNVSRKDNILNHILNQFGSISEASKEKYIDFIVEEKGAGNEVTIEKLYNLLISMKDARQSLVEKYAKEQFFSKEQKEELLKEIEKKDDEN